MAGTISEYRPLAMARATNATETAIPMFPTPAAPGLGGAGRAGGAGGAGSGPFPSASVARCSLAIRAAGSSGVWAMVSGR